MRLDQLAARIDAHQGAISADIHRAADPAYGNRVQRLSKADVMIRMYFALRPDRGIEAFALQRNQLRLLFRLENLPGHSPSGAVDAAAGHFTAPDQSPMGYVIEIDKGLAFEETLADITHTIFDYRFVLGMPWPSGIGQKATVGGVLEKGPIEARGVGVALIDTSFQSVDDDTPGSTAQKHQGAFEAIDDARQILPENRNHAADPAVAEGQDKSLNYPRSTAAEFLQGAEPAEVSFCHFSG